MPGVCRGGATGDLRAAMCAATQGSVIVFDTQAMCRGIRAQSNRAKEPDDLARSIGRYQVMTA